jgi:hypothetical protein
MTANPKRELSCYHKPSAARQSAAFTKRTPWRRAALISAASGKPQ